MENTTKPISKRMTTILSVLLGISVILNLLFFGGYLPLNQGSTPQAKPIAPGQLHHEGYELVQTVVLSRHNIRSPLSGKDSFLSTVTPHEWFAWSSNPAELSLRGGALETMMGQYFRKWLESEGLILENWVPQDGEVRFYANSKQRTIATTNYFKAGMLPVAKVDTETHAEYDTMDPVFNPVLTFTSEAYEKDAAKQMWDLYGDEIKSLGPNYELISKIIDLKDSKAYTSGDFTGFDAEDVKLVLEVGKEPRTQGSLNKGTVVSDALVLQYYEAPNELDASFGHPIEEGQWNDISLIKDTGLKVMFGTPLLCVNEAHPLLSVIKDELNMEGRKFTFLCGHDSNLVSVMSSLGVEDYTLPDSVEKNAAIGSKLVISRWKSPDGKEWISADVVYQTTSQLRGMELLDSKHHPAVYRLSFEGLEQNEDGLYSQDAFMERLDTSIQEYDVLKEKYGQ